MSKNLKFKKIGFVLSLILLVLALIADILSIIPGISNIVATIFWIIFFIVSWLKGYGVVSFRRAVTPAVSWIVEQVPGGSVVPTILLGVIISLGLMKAEQKTGIDIAGKMTGKGSSAPLYQDGVRMTTKAGPLYQDGVRMPTQGGDIEM